MKRADDSSDGTVHFVALKPIYPLLRIIGNAEAH